MTRPAIASPTGRMHFPHHASSSPSSALCTTTGDRSSTSPATHPFVSTRLTMIHINSTIGTSTGNSADPIHHSGFQTMTKSGLSPSDCTLVATGFLIAMMVFLTIVHTVRVVSVYIQRKGWELDNVAAQISYALSLAMMSYGMACESSVYILNW
jgi:hypothetical protein